MSGYVKIYGTILGSSIWAEAMHTRIVWITMLALADENGKVIASTSGLARFANVSIPQCREAIAALSSPDEDSGSPEEGGRRVSKVERGWLIVNYQKYREMRSPKQVADAERQRQWRERNRDASQESQEVATTEAVAVAVKSSSSSSSSSSREVLLASVPNRQAWEAEMNAALQGMHGPPLTPAQLDQAINDYVGNGASDAPNLRQFRAYLRSSGKPSSGTALAPRRKTIGERSFENAMRAVESIAGEDR